MLADELSDLKAEIAAQRQAAEAQRQRLEALERKLDAVQTTQTQAADSAKMAAASAGSVSGAMGEGLSYRSPNLTVTLYGLIDVSLSSSNNADASGARLTSYQTAWFSGNRFGITGKRDLNAGGLNAIFRLESEFLYQTGEQDAAGILFGRDAWAGFESADLGKLTFGRQNAVARDFAAIYRDPYGAAQTSTEEGGGTHTNNFKQLIFYAGNATGNRSTLYASVFYHFDKRSEVYLAADYLKLGDGYKVAVTNGFACQTELALGFRTRF